jgi:hypothetical protein
MPGQHTILQARHVDELHHEKIASDQGQRDAHEAQQDLDIRGSFAVSTMPRLAEWE